MRYVGNEYDDFDEDDVQDEDDDFEDEQDDDDDGGSPPARVNPFNTGSGGYGSSQQRTSSLPGANRPGVTSPPGSSPLTSRTSPPPAAGRPGAPGQSSTLSPPPRPGAGSPPGSTSPATPRYGGTTPTSGSNPASGSTPYGGNRFTPGSSSASSPASSSAARPATPASTSSAFGAKPATPVGAKPAEEKKSGGLGGLFGRGDDKAKDSKSPAKPASAGSSNPLSSLGGLTSRFTGGGKDAGAKPATPAKPAGEKSGGLFGRFTGGGKADDKKPGATTSTGSFNRAGTAPGSSSAVSSAASAVKRPFGALGGSGATNNNPATPKAAKAQSGAGGLSRFLPFLGGGKDAADKRQVDKKARASKAPKIEGSGLSLDNKLDILGVALVLASLALFFSRISTNKGQLTEWANNLLTQTFGWGAVAVPMAMMAVGVWLIARHFGDEAPVVPPGRIIGIVVGYVGLLIFMQFVDSFSYSNSNGTAVTLNELEKVWLPLAVVRGSGGGWIGSNLYFLLASNLTEYGAFLGAIFLLIVGIMFILNLSAAELTMIVVSVVRSFNDARQRRVQRRAQANALSLEQLTAQAATAPPVPVTVTKPQPEALPAAPLAPALPAATAEAALPAGELAAERNISINIGGRREPLQRGDMLPVENVPGRGAGQPASAKTMDKGLAPAPAGGSFTSRLRSAIPTLPGTKSAADKSGVIKPEGSEAAVSQTAEKSGGFRGMFNRQATTSAASAEANAAPVTKPENGEKSSGFRGMFNRNAAKPAVEAPAASAQTAAPATPVTGKPPVAAPAASTASSPVPAVSKPATGPQIPSSPQEEPRRLGDMLKPATASASTPAFGERKSPLSPATPINPPASRPFGADKPSTSPVSPVSSAAAATADKRATSDFSAAPSLRSPVTDPAKPAASGLKPPEKSPLSPPAKSPFGAPTSVKPSAIFDDEDDLDDELDDEFDDMLDDDDEPDTENVAELAPAKPRGTGPLPRPEDNRSRFSPTTFGSGGSKLNNADQPGSAERLDRLNAIRSGGVGTGPLKPETEKTDKPEVAKPAAAAASVEKQAPVMGKPASNGGPVTSPVSSSPLRTEPLKPAASVSSVAATASAASAATKDSGSDKKPQPAPNFWKPGGEPPRPTGAPPSPELPKPEVKPAAASFGKPDMPPGVTMNIPLTNSTPAPTASASTPTINTPPPPSAELPIRGAGVGTSAPAGIRRHKEWKLPAYASLLMPGSEGDIDRESLLRRARIIEDTLSSFGAPGKVVEVNTGPVITQFGVEPDYLVTRSGKKNRVKVSAIAQLDKDIQLALGAKSIRIEAPVPGKGYVGLEVPNEVASLVGLRDVMESDNFKKIKSPLAIALGQSVDGTPIAADLTTMPHLLVAGTTGSGKSVCVNAIISSLILCNPPDRVKFIMVDPKRVELTGYNGIPHLVAPVVVDLERIVGVLKWVTREMDERYKKFSNAGARNIEDFNKHLNESDPMPYIVVIIDELADLMMLAPDETERVITRIAALARATGIHLVIATQRPSVDVVTGLIKANFPARIAFAVAGGVDSRVILDQPGAERLLGRGDMLYMSGDSPAPLRLQGVYVSDTEINNITRYWKAQVSDDDQPARPISALVLDNTVAEPSRSVLPNNERQQIQQAFWEQGEKSSVSTGLGSDNDDVPDDQEDELYEQAVEMVRRLDKASVSLLQRRLRIGYTRAARLIDRMEEEGIVGPAVEGSKPREVLPPR